MGKPNPATKAITITTQTTARPAIFDCWLLGMLMLTLLYQIT
jgi:hypothetical protein